ncbi:hypothetical protein HanIR_Chr11g0552061 [Helianthus annuus]|nr:hypothetical protein HanIR_Chr11g0552061 [Helianthus annuus]
MMSLAIFTLRLIPMFLPLVGRWMSKYVVPHEKRVCLGVVDLRGQGDWSIVDIIDVHSPHETRPRA